LQVLSSFEMDPEKQRGVGRTSLMIAAARAIETKKPVEVRLFQDIYAEKLTGAESGVNLLKEFESKQKGIQKLFALRTKFIDNTIKDAVLSRAIRQVVILGSGMDTRPLRLELSEEVTFFELDFASVIDYKNEILEPLIKLHNISTKRVCIKTDLSKVGWDIQLTNSGFNSNSKSLFILEGLVMYIDPEGVYELLRKINRLMSSGSEILVHTVTKEYVDSERNKSARDVLSSVDAPMKFGIDDPNKLYEGLGFSKVEVSGYKEIAANLNYDLGNTSIFSWFVLGTKGNKSKL